MSRNRIDYGVDLGTTNSALARMESGKSVIRKNKFGSDTTPSAVAFDRKGRVHVGQQALDQLSGDRLSALTSGEYKPNVFVEFKRTMGTDELHIPAAMPDTSWTSEQLSAEVLKKLKDCIQDEPVHAAVITIPAEFKGAQQQATLKAAELAGLTQARLLQEPVAAAMAYGLDAGNKSGKWLVFDFGGGTFDSALVLVEDGIITVKDSEGDNFLGGKDLDMALVDQVLIPSIQKDYDIQHVLYDENRRERFRMALKQWAEKAKVELSFSDTIDVLSQLNDDLGEDASGEEIELDFTITRAQMADAVRPIFQRAIDKTTALLSRHGLTGTDLDELILVGGPTFSPILRGMLAEQIRMPNTSVDPMTCVARGAALFASTAKLNEETKEILIEEASNGIEQVVLDVNYQSTTVNQTEFVTVKLKEGGVSGASVELEREGWSSGKVALGDRGALIEAVIKQGDPNQFQIVLTDATGNRLNCYPSSITILPGIGVGGASLPNSLGVEVRSGDAQVFASLTGAEKSKRLPVIGVRNGLKTLKDIRPGVAEDSVKIRVYEGGSDAQGSPAMANDFMVEFQMTGKDVKQFIPKGAQVDLTVETGPDSSLPVKVNLFFPAMDEEVDLDVPTIINKKNPQAIVDLMLRECGSLASQMGQKGVVDSVLLSRLMSQLEEVKGMFAVAGNRGDKDRAMQRLKEVYRALANLEASGRWGELEQELSQEYSELLSAQSKNGSDSTRMQVEHMKERLDRVKVSKDVPIAKQLISEMGRLAWQLNKLENMMSTIFFWHRNFNSLTWSNSTAARQAVDAGMAAVSDNPSEDSVRPHYQAIYRLRVFKDSDSDASGAAGTLGADDE